MRATSPGDVTYRCRNYALMLANHLVQHSCEMNAPAKGAPTRRLYICRCIASAFQWNRFAAMC